MVVVTPGRVGASIRHTIEFLRCRRDGCSYQHGQVGRAGRDDTAQGSSQSFHAWDQYTALIIVPGPDHWTAGQPPEQDAKLHIKRKRSLGAWETHAVFVPSNCMLEVNNHANSTRYFWHHVRI